MSRTFLYRRLRLAVIVILALFILALFGATASQSVAQGRPQLKRPEEAPPPKPPEPPKKKVKGPRAIAILQLNSTGKGTLIPVAILVEGRFYDASVYKADPVPMALESGTVYEVEQTGDSLGLFTINGALHSKNVGSPTPWLGAGSYVLNGTEAAKTTRKAEDVPVGIDNSGSDAPPRLTRKGASKPADTASSPSAPPSSTAPGSTAPGSTAPGSTAPAPATAGSSEKPAATTPPASTADRAADQSAKDQSAKDQAAKDQAPEAADTPPAQAAPAQTSSAPASSAPATPSQASPSQTPPSQAQPTQSSAGQAAPAQKSSGQESENYYRPTLRRGKPTQAAPEDDDETATKAAKPGSGKPGSDKAGSDKAGSGASAAAPANAGPIQMLAAISDSGGPDPRSYKFFWKEGEENDRRQQMLSLAGDEVRAYATALVRNRIPAKPPAPKPSAPGHKTPAKAVQPVLENIQFHAFDVGGNNQPVIILSAEAHLPPQPGDDAAPQTYSITLVARTDIYGNLRKLYSGVTDKFHLDVTPRLELIDAVDADGDGRGELLFRETTDAGSGYIVYRAAPDKLFKMFDSLGEKQ